MNLPLKRGAISKGKDRFLKFAIFHRDMWMFFGGAFVGVWAMGHRMPAEL